MTVTLILTLCLLSDPTHCRQETRPGYEYSACMMIGEIELMRAAEEQPKWFARGWGCRVGERARGMRT